MSGNAVVRPTSSLYVEHCGSAKASSNQTLPDMQFAPPSASCLSLPSLPDVHAIPQLQKEAPQGADEYDGISRLANQLGKYELIRQVGSGNSGKVILAHRVGQKNVSPVVIKAVRRSNHKEFTERTTLNEVKTLQTVRATGNMSFVQLEESFADVYNRYFVFEYLSGGTLWDAAGRAGGKLEKPLVRMIIAELIDATQFLHKAGIIHRDIKEDNILLDSRGHVVLGDFGLAILEASEDVKDEDDDEQSPRSPLRSNGSYSRRAVCGTPGYMAPELMSGDPYSYPVDAWAIGCVMYQLLIGVLPFQGQRFNEIRRQTVYSKLEFPSGHGLDYITRHFLGSLLEKNPKKRLTIDDAKETAYLEEINWHRVRERDYDVPVEWLPRPKNYDLPETKRYKKDELVDPNVPKRETFVESDEFEFITPLYDDAGKRTATQQEQRPLLERLTTGLKLRNLLSRNKEKKDMERDIRVLFKLESLHFGKMNSAGSSHELTSMQSSSRDSSTNFGQEEYQRCLGPSAIESNWDTVGSTEIIIGSGQAGGGPLRCSSQKVEKQEVPPAPVDCSESPTRDPERPVSHCYPPSRHRNRNAVSRVDINEFPFPPVPLDQPVPPADGERVLRRRPQKIGELKGLRLLNVPALTRSQSTITPAESPITPLTPRYQLFDAGAGYPFPSPSKKRVTPDLGQMLKGLPYPRGLMLLLRSDKQLPV